MKRIKIDIMDEENEYVCNVVELICQTMVACDGEVSENVLTVHKNFANDHMEEIKKQMFFEEEYSDRMGDQNTHTPKVENVGDYVVFSQSFSSNC